MPVDPQTAERLLDELLDAHSVYQHAYDAELKDARWKYKETRAAVLSAMTVSEGWKLVPTDTREWPLFVMPMPLNKNGDGPATIGDDAVTVRYEVWDRTYKVVSTHDNISDAVEACLLAAAPKPPQPEPSADDVALVDEYDRRCAIVRFCGKEVGRAQSEREAEAARTALLARLSRVAELEAALMAIRGKASELVEFYASGVSKEIANLADAALKGGAATVHLFGSRRTSFIAGFHMAGSHSIGTGGDAMNPKLVDEVARGGS